MMNSKPARGRNIIYRLGILVGVSLLLVLSGCSSKDNRLVDVQPSDTLQPITTFTPLPTNTSTPTPTHAPIPSTSTPALGIGSTIVSEKDGAILLYVPEGEFIMGSNDRPLLEDQSLSDFDNRPQRSIYLDAFWIDQSEVTNKQYARCVLDKICILPSNLKSPMRSSYYGYPEFDNYPVIYVDWYMAKAYCEWAGHRLPTEAEWEKAARGTDGRIYPWGNIMPGDNLLNYNNPIRDTTEVGNYPDGQSPYGAYDMAGNVWEWVSSLRLPYPYDKVDGREDLSVYEDRVLRGGAWFRLDGSVRAIFYSGTGLPDLLVRTDLRNSFAPKYENISKYFRPPFGFGTVGFRCAMSTTL